MAAVEGARNPETMSTPDRRRRPQDAAAAVGGNTSRRAPQNPRALLHELDVTSVRLLDNAPARLAVLKAGTGLKLPDCCVLLAAEQTHGAVATFNDRLANAATGRGLAIRTS